jgi:hypothetical protein
MQVQRLRLQRFVQVLRDSHTKEFSEAQLAIREAMLQLSTDFSTERKQQQQQSSKDKPKTETEEEEAKKYNI